MINTPRSHNEADATLYTPLIHQNRGEGTRYDGSCGSTEHGLENKEAGGRISSAIITLHKEIRCADKAAYVLAEHQTKAQNPEDDGAKAHIHYILHYDVSSVFSSGKAGLYHGEARLHRKYQEGTD